MVKCSGRWVCRTTLNTSTATAIVGSLLVTLDVGNGHNTRENKRVFACGEEERQFVSTWLNNKPNEWNRKQFNMLQQLNHHRQGLSKMNQHRIPSRHANTGGAEDLQDTHDGMAIRKAVDFHQEDTHRTTTINHWRNMKAKQSETKQKKLTSVEAILVVVVVFNWRFLSFPGKISTSHSFEFVY